MVWRKNVADFQKSRVVEKCPKKAKTVEKEALLKNMLKNMFYNIFFISVTHSELGYILTKYEKINKKIFVKNLCN